MSRPKSSRIATTLEHVLSEEELNALGIALGQSLRLRVVTPHRLVLCLLGANLRKFDTANPHIAEGLIWASLAVAILKRYLAHAAQLVSGVAISTRKVAMCGGVVVRTALEAVDQPLRLVASCAMPSRSWRPTPAVRTVAVTATADARAAASNSDSPPERAAEQRRSSPSTGPPGLDSPGAVGPLRG